jgi:hypothetical protein
LIHFADSQQPTAYSLDGEELLAVSCRLSARQIGSPPEAAGR